MIIELLNKDIAEAVSIVVAPGSLLELPDGFSVLTFFANFAYGAGGTSVKAYIQTSLDGVNWFDIACFAFTTSAVKKILNMIAGTAITSAVTLSDGALTDNTAVSGIVGKFLRVKYVTVGTYSGATNLIVAAKIQ